MANLFGCAAVSRAFADRPRAVLGASQENQTAGRECRRLGLIHRTPQGLLLFTEFGGVRELEMAVQY